MSHRGDHVHTHAHIQGQVEWEGTAKTLLQRGLSLRGFLEKGKDIGHATLMKTAL